jgi:hypothetical protein
VQTFRTGPHLPSWAAGGAANLQPEHPPVVLTGEPGELVLHCFGRGAQAQVTIDGGPGAVAAFSALQLGV